MPRQGKKDWHEEAKKDPDVWRWFTAREANNYESADVNLRNLMRSLDELGKTPKDLLGMSKPQLSDFMQDFINHFLRRGILGSTVSKYVDGVKSWLDHNNVQVARKLRIPGADENPRAEAQLVPNPTQLSLLLAACDLRTSVITAMETMAGVRPQVLGRRRGEDGLMLGDFPELTLRPLGFSKVPARIKVRRPLSKTRKPYSTFAGPLTCDLIVAYLRSREIQGEKLGPASPLVIPKSGPPRFCQTNNLQDCLRKRMRTTDIQASTYITRSYFANRMAMAESHGVSAMYAQFWMGHKGSMMSKYALQKELPDEAVEDMRSAFAKAVPILEPVARDDADPMRRITELVLAAGGVPSSGPQPDLDALDDAGLAKVFVEAMTQRVEAAGTKALGRNEKPANGRQKVVAVDDVDRYLEEGWTFKHVLSADRVIVERKG